MQGDVEHRWLTDTFVLEVLQASGPIELRGFRVGDDAELDWPWDQGVTFVYRPGGAKKSQRVRFRSAALYPGPEDSVDVLWKTSGGTRPTPIPPGFACPPTQTDLTRISVMMLAASSPLSAALDMWR